MFIDDCTYTRHGKTYRRVLLRNSYRVDGTVRHDTLANLSQCADEEIEAIKFGLRRIFPQKTGFEATGKPRLMRAWAGFRPGKSSHVISGIFILLILTNRG